MLTFKMQIFLHLVHAQSSKKTWIASPRNYAIVSWLEHCYTIVSNLSFIRKIKVLASFERLKYGLDSSQGKVGKNIMIRGVCIDL